MEITHLFAGLVVSDFTKSCEWYERLFDSPPDVLPKEGEAVWHAGVSASVYITAGEARFGGGRLTLAVKDLEGHAADLGRRGLTGEASVEGNGMRTLLLADPDGNTIKFFEDPAAQ
ncbi:MAG TPA: VOC family protein [Gaiellaceae bacterium]|jgi:catechol 2,3-dioxygenase-like lactoylglutathione lyase family enzyme|nr:VOC family protein [Gaiellaceae bacterium]